MKKHLKWIVAILLVACIFTFVGCPNEPEPPAIENVENGSNSGNNAGSNGGNNSGNNAGSNGGNNSGNNAGSNGGDNSGNNDGDIDDGNYKYKKSLWGKWTRIDNGEVYIVSGDEIRRENGWYDESIGTVSIESENVLVIGEGESAARLYRKAGGLTSFTAKVAGFQSSSRAAASSSNQMGMPGVKVSRESKDVSTDFDVGFSGEDGTIVFDNVVSGETQKITVETDSGKTIELDVTPSYEGENVGTIPIVESGYSFKTTYNIYDMNWNSDYYLFGNNYTTYNLRLNFTNIGDATCATATYELSSSDPNIELSKTTGVITSVAEGSTKSFDLQVSYGDLQEFCKDVTIDIKIVDTKENRTWLDSVTLRFYQAPVFLNFYAYNAGESGSLNGFILCPDGRAEYFYVYHNDYSTKILPYNKNGDNDYKVVFSATSDYAEMAYAFSANYNGNSPYVDFNEIFEDTTTVSNFIYSYEDGEGNDNEETAVFVEDPYCTTMSYIQYGDIDYFNLNLDDVLYSRIEEIKIPRAGVSASGKEVVVATVKGKNFKSPLENVKFSSNSDYVISELNKTIIDDETMYVELQIPSVAKDYVITAESEWNTLSRTFTVEDYDVETGDYVLKDNRVVRKGYFSELTEEEKELIFGVINVSRTGAPYIVGLNQSDSVMWAATDTGVYTNFTSIQSNCYFSDSGEYIFTGDIDGSDNWEEICKLDPEGTKDAATNYPVFNFAANYGKTYGLTGTEFEEGWYVPSVAELYEVYLNKDFLTSSLSAVCGDLNLYGVYWSSSPYENSNDYPYGVDFYWSNVCECYKGNTYSVLVIHPYKSEQFRDYNYPDAKIESVTIQTAGEGYTGELPVTIIGENLKGYKVTCSDPSFGNVTYVSDTKVTATITCDGVKGETSITVTIDEDTCTGTVKVIAAEDAFNVGDILFTDGTRIKAENAKYGVPDSQISKAFGVVVSASYGGGTGKVVGLQKSTYTLQWAPSGTTGYNTNFSEIYAYCNSYDYDGESYNDWSFYGDLDGSDNWDVICEVDPEGSQNPATNYPVFNYALNYGETAGLTGTDYEDGWYVPAVAELLDVYTNKDVVQTSLSEVNGFVIGDYYWSSSQGSSYYCSNWINFSNGETYDNSYKDNSYYVLVIQALNAEQFTDYEYADAKIENVTIQTAGEGYTEELPVTIEGENLKGHAITCSDSSFSNVTYVSDTKVTATITCDGVEGETSITVTIGNDTETGTVKVLAEEDAFNVGDILFTDGTRIKAENAKYGVPDSQISKAFGVVVSASYGGGTGKVVGLQKSTYSLQWAPSGTTGYETDFSEIYAYCHSYDYDGESYNDWSCHGDLDGSDNWDVICEVDPEGSQNPATNYPVFNYALNYGETAGLTGTDYEDGWYVPAVAELLDVYINREILQTSLTEVNGFVIGDYYWSSSQGDGYYGSGWINCYNGEVYNYSSKDNSYSVLVIKAFNAEQFVDYVSSTTPEIESVTIPTAGEGYTGELPVTIIGENLKGHAITCSDSSFSNITYVSDTKVTATITCDGVEGETSITVTIDEDTCTGTVKVIAEEDAFNVGDILFTDGTRIKAENAKYGVPDSQISKAFGVVVSASYGGGTGKVVGLQKSDVGLQWAPSKTTGYDTNFKGIQARYVDYEYIDGKYISYVFTGDLDGSDNWEYICDVDSVGTQNPIKNYPVFNYALNYGETDSLKGTDYAAGWYIPSVAELFDVYTNKEVVQTSLTAVGGFEIGTSYYWSSSQNTADSYYAAQVNFNKGNVDWEYKVYGSNVLVIKAFNAEQFDDYVPSTTPEITSVTIPTVGEGYTGELPVTIEGANLKGHVITCDDSSFSNVICVSDTKVTATITFDGADTIWVTSGSDTEPGEVKVVSTDNCYKVGDIILADGSKVSVDEVDSYEINNNNKPVGVVTSVSYGGGVGNAVGLKQSTATYWSHSGIDFEEIQSHYSYEYGENIFSGDLDGSDNWEEICNVDKECTQESNRNYYYPVFDFALNYGETAGLTGTDYEDGWYVPAVAELYDIYTNKEVVKNSLIKAGGFTIEDSYYWSSSQYTSYYAYAVDFGNGEVQSRYNYGDYCPVLVIRAFNSK